MTLPPGQVKARRWALYAVLGTPSIDIGSWSLEVSGLVKTPLKLNYRELLDMPQVRLRKSFHCVTGWSIEDVEWEGVRIRDLAELAGVREEAKWVMFWSVEGYSAPIPLEAALREDSIIAFKMNGEPIPHEHGFPARPVIPSLYGWKSVKWLCKIEFMEKYVDGFWESRGYHERGDVWREERFKT